MKSWPRSRGSEWRKWDLHLHSPGTKLNDQFKISLGESWDEYCRVLHDSDVQVFGITDYFSADGYFDTLANFRSKYPNSSKVFFPNVELRTAYVVNKAQEEVNVHLIFNPFQPNFENKIDFFLQSLRTNKTEDDSGRNVVASELNTEQDYGEATTTREFIRDALENTYGSAANWLDYLLIVTAANNDGIRPERGKQRKLLITDELDKFSDGFLGHAGNVAYFLSPDRAEDKTKYTKPKPVLSGCDAHSFSELDERLGQFILSPDGISLGPTWIKSDLTFEGLKQIIFEPENRVYIGKEPEIERRVRENKTKYIKALHVTSVDGYQGDYGIWFNDEQIPLGKELVAIIGNKGSGKSAVTDIIGLLGNSHNQTSRNLGRSTEELFSFLNKRKFLKKGYAKHFYGQLVWHEGEPDRKSLDAEVAKNLPEKVEYLPQKYLEGICANIDDDEFRATLNEVIFRYVEPRSRHGQTDLEGLIEYLTQQASEDIQKSKHKLHRANEKVMSIERKLTTDYREKIKEELRIKREELEAHQKEAPVSPPEPPDAGTDSTAEDAAKIESLTQAIADSDETIELLQDEQIQASELVEELGQIKQAIQREAETLLSLESQYQDTLESTGLVFKEIVKLKLDYSELDALVNNKNQRLKEIEASLLTKEDITEEFGDGKEDQAARIAAISASVICRRANLESEKAELVERMAKPAREYQEYRNQLKIWTNRKQEICGDDQNPAADSLKGKEKELDRIETGYPEKLRNAQLKQVQISREVFQKKKDLTHFYNMIKQSIDKEIGKCLDDLGDYTISVEAGLRFTSSFFEKFLRFINQSVRGSFYGIEEGKSMLKGLCDAVDNWESESEVFNAIETITEALHFDRRSDLSPSDDKDRDIFTQMKNQENPVVELYDYLFGFDYLEPKYDLKIDQKDLSELSPGERGGLLLIFYLMLDRQNIPLVIDQPEDNLDNKSVYEILVKFIKQAKKRRQIILVTHNPNLAVVADAEQIIHVSIDKEEEKYDFDFFSGSIEAPQINQVVVDILEGTLPAFDNRRLKYRR